MCGIAGIIGDTGSGEQVIRAMLQAQQYRGPDALQWQQWEGQCILGHNRLSIIDLQESANQPMRDASGRYTIVFNGEIYNYLELRQQLGDYPFRTHSDTEVILAAYLAWGAECLEKFNGMFSLAIWDEVEHTLFAARDRFGVKPFYYAQWQGALYFASEINTLFAAGLPRQPNHRVWSAYFTKGLYGMPDETFWNHIVQLPAGHSLRYAGERLSVTRWYDFVSAVQTLGDSVDPGWEEEYRALLVESVRLRFRADVPVGFNLSGGLDSSTLLALVNRCFPGGKIEAFTFTTGHPGYDELPWVEQMLAITGNPLHECRLEAGQIPGLAEAICRHQAEPMGGFPTIAYANVFKEARRRGIIVLLDGQGMDEAWAGYDYYTNQSGSVVQGTQTSPLRPLAIAHDMGLLAEESIWPKPFDNTLQNLQYRDIMYTKIPRALRFNDRISMWHSTELREPFLDYRLVELAFSRPESMKIREGQQKWMLRQIATEMLGSKLALAPKRPVQTPQREWMGHELRDWVTDCLERFCTLPWVNRQVVQQEWDAYRHQGSDNSFFLWQWVNTALILT